MAYGVMANRAPVGSRVGFSAVAIAVCLCFPFRAGAMDWTSINDGNAGNWTAATEDTSSSKTSFLHVDNSDPGAASGNTLTVGSENRAGGSVPQVITGRIYGGYSDEKIGYDFNTAAVHIDGNSVTVYAPTAGSTAAISGNVDVYGGFKNNSSSGSPTVSINDNRVIIHSGVDLGTGIVVGALLNHSSSSLQTMSGNSVTIYGGTMDKIGGAIADSQAVNLHSMDNNRVTVDLRNSGALVFGNSGSSTSGYIFGADFLGSTSVKGAVTNNTVAIYADDSSTMTRTNGIHIYGGRFGRYPGVANNNQVVIDFTARTAAAPAFGRIRGGSSGNSGSAVTTYFADNAASYNTVRISGSRAMDVVATAVMGGQVYTGEASNNNVYLTDVTVGPTDVTTTIVGVYGGYAVDAFQPDLAIGAADNNGVTILRGTMRGDIYGGFDGTTLGRSANGNRVDLADVIIASQNVYGGSSNAESKDNSVSISGYGTRFTNAMAVLAGGNNGLDNNTLTTSSALDLTVNTVRNFENYIFNYTAADMNRTVYSITNSVDLAGTNHTLNFDATQGPPLQENQVLTLLDNTTGDGTYTTNIKDGFLYNYDSFFGLEGNSLVFRILGRADDDRNITFGQSQLVGLQMVNFASDLARSVAGLYNNASERCADSRTGNLVVFAGAHGGSYRWNTGFDSRVHLRHVSMLTGLGWRPGDLLLAGFFEAGHGKYDARVGGRRIVDGENSNYVGGGALARYERDGLYAETGLHAGRVNTNFDSLRFGTAADPAHVSYKNRSTYFGVDALMGYKLAAGRAIFDLSARYSWSHAKGKDFTTRDVRFDQGSANSHRIRAGAEWSLGLSAATPYAGAYYEHELDSESSHRVAGEKLRKASKRGASGIGRLGVRLVDRNCRFSADVGVEGYIGKRRGISGKALLGYAF